MMKIEEVIVVEGKSDTKRIKLAVEADTFETRGSAISEDMLEQLEILAQKRGLIVFTDPDFSGEKIRKIIQEAIPGVKHAFLNKKEACPKAKGSLGVEHASVEAIREALKNLYTEKIEDEELISKEELLSMGLIYGSDAKKKRKLLGEKLHIGYTNGKQLYKRLKLFQINQKKLKKALLEIEGEFDG